MALATTGLAVLAMGNRLLLLPEAASVVCMAVAVEMLHRQERASRSIWSGWGLVILSVVWCDLDGRFWGWGWLS